jgi:hypothetical protein
LNVEDIIADAERHGITMKLDGERLALHAERKPPDKILDKITEHTRASIRHLMDKETVTKDHEIGTVTRADALSPSEMFADNVLKSLLRRFSAFRLTLKISTWPESSPIRRLRF